MVLPGGRIDMEKAMKVKVYGASDDLVEVEGDLREEFSVWDKWVFLHFKDGTVIKAGYAREDFPDKGWHIEAVKVGDNSAACELPAEQEDGKHFSDVLEITGELGAVRCRETPDPAILITEAVKFFEEVNDFGDFDGQSLCRAYDILTGWAD